MKILSIDGGGVFGIIPAYFISCIDISDFDIIAGTSVGAILSLMYACDISGEEVFDIVRNDLPNIFGESRFILFNGPKFKDKNLNSCLQKNINRKIGDLSKKIVVPTFDVKSNEPKIFENFSKGSDLSIPAWEVARMSSAAPSYFPAWNGALDGGIAINNPTFSAIILALRNLNVKLSDIEVFSFGTGEKSGLKNGEAINKWYRWDWIFPMIRMVTSNNAIVAHENVELMPLKKYVRFNPIKIKNHWDFVDPSCINECIDEAVNCKPYFLKTFNDFMRESKGSKS